MKKLLTLITLAAGVMAGCESQQALSPTAQLETVRVAEQTDDGVRLEAVVVLTNPNDEIALPLENASYRLELNGRTFAADLLPQQTLPPMSQQRVVLPAAVADGQQASDYRFSAQLTYRPPGEIRDLLTEMSVPLPMVSVAGGGQLAGPQPQ